MGSWGPGLTQAGLGIPGGWARDPGGGDMDPGGGAGSRGWAGDPGGGAGCPAHMAVWRRSENTRSVKSASSPARAALGTTR